VGGLVASIPAFLDGPAREPAHSAPYGWTRALPLVPAGYGSFTAEAKPIATSREGRELLAVRQGAPGGDMVCLEYAPFSAGCLPPVPAHPIELFARLHYPQGTSFVGILAGNVNAVRVRHAGGASDIEARRGFVVREDSAQPIISLVALDAGGRELGTVAADAPVAVECDDTACTSSVTFSLEGY